MKQIIAIDIGGTKIAAACYADGVLSARSQIRTPAEQRDPELVLRAIVQLVKQTAEQGGLTAIDYVGVACPGPLSPSQGVVINAPTLGWVNYPLRSRLQEELGCPVLLENDANCAAYGEYCMGAGKGCESIAYITVSTGVGAGIVAGGKLLEGYHESAGELGHLHMVDDGEPCVCGRVGCLEAHASGTGIGKQYQKLMRSRGEEVEPSALACAEKAKAGDKECMAIYQEAGKLLGRAFAILQMVCDVEKIILGGSVSSQLELLYPTIAENAAAFSYWGENPDKWLELCALGADAGLVGAGALALEKATEQ